jgi:hypothetical protein
MMITLDAITVNSDQVCLQVSPLLGSMPLQPFHPSQPILLHTSIPLTQVCQEGKGIKYLVTPDMKMKKKKIISCKKATHATLSLSNITNSLAGHNNASWKNFESIIAAHTSNELWLCKKTWVWQGGLSLIVYKQGMQNLVETHLDADTVVQTNTSPFIDWEHRVIYYDYLYIRSSDEHHLYTPCVDGTPVLNLQVYSSSSIQSSTPIIDPSIATKFNLSRFQVVQVPAQWVLYQVQALDASTLTIVQTRNNNNTNINMDKFVLSDAEVLPISLREVTPGEYVASISQQALTMHSSGTWPCTYIPFRFTRTKHILSTTEPGQPPESHFMYCPFMFHANSSSNSNSNSSTVASHLVAMALESMRCNKNLVINSVDLWNIHTELAKVFMMVLIDKLDQVLELVYKHDNLLIQSNSDSDTLLTLQLSQVRQNISIMCPVSVTFRHVFSYQYNNVAFPVQTQLIRLIDIPIHFLLLAQV